MFQSKKCNQTDRIPVVLLLSIVASFGFIIFIIFNPKNCNFLFFFINSPINLNNQVFNLKGSTNF